MSLLIAIIFPILLILSVPVAHALLLSGALAILIEGRLPLEIAATRLFTPTQSFPMLAIPFFILAGDLMMSGKFGEYLIDFSKLMVGRMKGGLSQVSVIGSMMFGGVSGSAVADASALGNALIPVQKREGYPPGFAAAVNAASSTVSVLIPPSIPLILYGLVSETSIIDLFIAGIVPGIMLAIGMFVLCYVKGRLRNLPRSPLDGGFQAYRTEILRAIPALLMPVFIIIILRFGIATPTETSVMAVAYAFVIGIVIYRDLTPRLILQSMLTAGMMTGAVMLVIMGSSVVQFILTVERVPIEVANWLLTTLENPMLIILSMNLLMIIIGTFLDIPAAILLLTPIFVGVAAALGLNSVQLGVMMVVNLAMGLYTPPVGTTLFISATIARTPIGTIVGELVPFYAVALLVLALVSYVPFVTTMFL